MTKGQRQRLTRVAMYAVFVAVVVVIALMADWTAIRRNFFDLEVARGMFPKVVTIAAKNTVLYTAIAFVGGLVLGLVLALMKMSSVLPYRVVANAYIELFRGLPALLTILFMAFALPIALQIRVPGGTTGAAVFGLVLVAGAYMAETIRAGIQAVPRGQMEAARSLGMSHTRAMVSIIIPQAFRVVIPPLTNELVLLIKDTSLIAFAGSQPIQEELTKFGRDGAFSNSNQTPFIVVGLLYLLITFPLTRVVARLEARNERSR